MGELALAVVLGVVVLAGLLLFLGRKIFRNPDLRHKPAIIELLCAAALITLWALVIPWQPLQLWQRILVALSAQYGVLLYYIAMDEILNDERRNILKNRAFYVTTLLVVIVIILDFHLGDHQPSFISPARYTLTWISFSESALSYLGLLYLETLIVWVYVKDLQRHSDLIYTIRRGMCILGFLVNILGLLLLEGGLLLSLLVKGGYGLVLNSLYPLSVLIMAFLVAGSYVPPNCFFTTALRPIYEYMLIRRERQQELLSYLHQIMVQIVPGVQFDFEEGHDLRVPIEISGAREIIWSHEQCTKPPTPEDEANLLFNLISTSTVWKELGNYTYIPAQVCDRIAARHNVAVAKHLKRLQGNEIVGQHLYRRKSGNQAEQLGTFPQEIPTDSTTVTSVSPLHPRLRSWTKVILVSLSVLLFILFMATSGLTWYLCDRLMYPQRVPITHVPTSPYVSVQLETADHVVIRGWFIPAPPGTGKAPAILLLHGVADNRNAFNIDCRATDAKDVCPSNSPYARGGYPTFIKALHWHGYAVLAIDQRAQGESGGNFCTYGLYETRDVAAALAYLQGRSDVDSKRLGIYGSSMGSITAIHAAALMPAFHAVAVESPFANLRETLQAVTAPLIGLPSWMIWPILKLYQLRTGVDITQLQNINDMAALGERPFYAIGDMRDRATLRADARRLYEASHSPLRRLWEVPDTDHTESLFYHPDEFYQRLLTFFDEALKK